MHDHQVLLARKAETVELALQMEEAMEQTLWAAQELHQNLGRLKVAPSLEAVEGAQRAAVKLAEAACLVAEALGGLAEMVVRR